MTQKMPIPQAEEQVGEIHRSVHGLGSGRHRFTAKLPDNLIAWVPDPDVADAYPIATFTWLLCYKKYPDPKKAEVVRDFLMYSLTEGQKESEALGYFPLPEALATQGEGRDSKRAIAG